MALRLAVCGLALAGVETGANFDQSYAMFSTRFKQHVLEMTPAADLLDMLEDRTYV